ncbi:hypothetical protein [Actinokineospora bangkokensis]|uniref:Uncharacterized protein n=1 Tax=Actinokineospora bangkokensis TaxID=1193682 RepID=A0A1Q9LNN3_9PSEU|nr:hypothetical protein [Actinokineospora bangkokensis]OLR93625.1 hypothetical protein BJP25_15210 [Actinokineospora bangkokensis]
MSEPITRRTLLAGLGVAGLVATVGVAPTASAVELPPIRDTFQGLLAYLVPGTDKFSQHQGVTLPLRGGADTGGAAPLERTYDQAIPFPVVGRPFNLNLPGAAAVAALLNIVALNVNPGALIGPFASSFANLKHAQKTEVLRRLEEPGLADGTPVRFVINTIPTLAAFQLYSEAPVFNRETQQLTGRPLGWDLSAYDGPNDGWAEFQGFYRGIDRVPE